jgi:hypothetical protein
MVQEAAGHHDQGCGAAVDQLCWQAACAGSVCRQSGNVCRQSGSVEDRQAAWKIGRQRVRYADREAGVAVAVLAVCRGGLQQGSRC